MPAGAGEEGSQPYLGARGAGCGPGDKMFDRVSPPAGMRPLSLIGPSAGALGRQRLTGGLQELAAVVPHRVRVAAGVPARVWRVLGVASMRQSKVICFR